MRGKDTATDVTVVNGLLATQIYKAAENGGHGHKEKMRKYQVQQREAGVYTHRNGNFWGLAP